MNNFVIVALIAFVIFGIVASAVHGWFSDKSKKLKEDEFNRKLRLQLLDEQRLLEQNIKEITHKLQTRFQYITDLRKEFEKGYVN